MYGSPTTIRNNYNNNNSASIITQQEQTMMTSSSSGRQRRKAIMVPSSPSTSPSMNNGRKSSDSNTSSPTLSPNMRTMMGSPTMLQQQSPQLSNNNGYYYNNTQHQHQQHTTSSPPLLRNVNTSTNHQHSPYYFNNNTSNNIPSQFNNATTTTMNHHHIQAPLTFTQRQPSPLYVQSPSSNGYVPSPSNSYSTTGTIRNNLANTKLVDSFIIEDDDDDEFMSSGNSQPVSITSPTFNPPTPQNSTTISSSTTTTTGSKKQTNRRDALESFDLIEDDDDDNYDIDQNFGSFTKNVTSPPIHSNQHPTTPNVANFMITPITEHDEFDEMDIDFGSSPFKSSVFSHAFNKPSSHNTPIHHTNIVNKDFNSDILFVSDDDDGGSSKQVQVNHSEQRRSTNDDEYDLMGLSETEPSKPSTTTATAVEANNTTSNSSLLTTKKSNSSSNNNNNYFQKKLVTNNTNNGTTAAVNNNNNSNFDNSSSNPLLANNNWKVGCTITDQKKTKSFQLLEQLGEGSYGTVFRVVQIGTNRIFALKRITINDYQEKEVKLMMMLDHPNIVKYYDSFMDINKRYYCILMEYCSGKILDHFISDLNDIMKESKGLKSLTMDVRFSWFIKLLEVLNYLHHNKVIHRDLKPQNIIVQYDSENLKSNFDEEVRRITLKIIDFGLAKQLVHRDSTSTICGTRAYVAPEIKPGTEYDYKVDVYSLGIIFMQVSACLTVKDFQHLIDQRARRHNIDFWLFMRSNHYFEFIHEHVFDIGSKRIVEMMVCAREERKSAAELLEHTVTQTWRFIFGNDSSQLLNILSRPESLLGFLSGLDTSSLFVKKSILGMKDLLSNEKLRPKCCDLISEYRVLPVLMFYISRKLFSDRVVLFHSESIVEELSDIYDEIFKSTLSFISQVLTYYDNQTDKRHMKRMIREMRNETSTLLVDELGRYSTTCILNFIHAKVYHNPEFFFTLSCLKIIFFLCKYDKSTRVGYCLWLERNQNKIGRSSKPLSDKKTQLLRGIYTYISLIEPGYATLLSPNYSIDPIFVEVFNEIPFHHRRAIIKLVWQKLAKILNLALDTGAEAAADRVLGVMNNFLYDFFSLEKYTTYHGWGNTKFGSIIGDPNVCGLPNSLYYLIPTSSGLLTQIGLLKIHSHVDRQTLIHHLFCNNLNPNDIKVLHFDSQPSSSSIVGNEKELIHHYLGNYSPVTIESRADFSHLVGLQGSPLKLLDNDRTLHFLSTRATKMSLSTKEPLFFFQPESTESRRFGVPSNANNRKPSMKTVFYYEVQIHRLISSKVSIGLMARSNISENNCVDRKYAFQAQDGFGFFMSADKKEILYKELEVVAHCGDLIGCGLTEQGEVYFTMNGIFLFSISLHQRIMHSSIFPFIEVLSTPNDECLLHLNLGENPIAEPFLFDHHQAQVLNHPPIHSVTHFSSEVIPILRSLNLNQLQSLPNFKGLRKFIELNQKR